MKFVFAVRDNAVEAFGQPFFCRARGEAVRSFIDETKNKESNFHKHPADYDLYYIGLYNEETGTLEAQPHERVARALDFIPA